MKKIEINFSQQTRQYKASQFLFLSSLVPLFREKMSEFSKKLFALSDSKKRCLYSFFSLKDSIGEELDLTMLFFEDFKLALKEFQKSLKELDFYLEEVFTQSSFYLEVHPGIGGHEALLFSEELLFKYQAVLHSLKLPFIKEEKRLFLPAESANFLSLERGVHRVQRIPVTESSGRVHTSTVQVKLVSVFRDLKVELNEKDLKFETMRSSGPGGQHVNTTSSAVRLTHLPTSTMVKIDASRTQTDNKIEAERVLKEKLSKYIAKIIEELARTDRGKFSLERSDKIRTYNFQTDRMTDHRSGTKVSIAHWEDPTKMAKFIERIAKSLS